MNTKLNPIKEALQTLTSTITTTVQNTYAAINADKATLLEILARMDENTCMLAELSTMLATTADELFDIAGEIDLAADNANNILDCGDWCRIPSSPIEKFVGICDECGSEITLDDEDYSNLPEEGFICSDCLLAASDTIEVCEAEEKVEEEA